MPPSPPPPPPPSSAKESCVDGADTAWVLLSTILVLLMIPALGLFEAGLLRAKNTTSVLTQVFAGAVMLGFLWDVIGFSLVFGDDWGFIGSPASYPLLTGVGIDDCFPQAPTIPRRAYAIFQMMFASITPLLMTGAFAERLRWPAFVALTLGFEVLVYFPVAHWIWGGGWLQRWGVLDFAGGIVIHTSAGVGAVVISWLLGSRRDMAYAAGPGGVRLDDVSGGVQARAATRKREYRRFARMESVDPSSLPIASVGGVLLWLGWFGFNAGSAMSVGPLATSAVSTTQAGAVSCGVVWMAWSTILHIRHAGRARMSLTSVLNGVIAGLAGITPASGFISSDWGLVVGAVLGVTSLSVEYLIKHKLRIDDALDVGAVHGATGAMGALLIGVFAAERINPRGANGLTESGSFVLLGKQAAAVLLVAVYSGLVSTGLGLLIRRTLGLRVDSRSEHRGLDLIDHDEAAYEWLAEDHTTHLLDGTDGQPLTGPTTPQHRRRSGDHDDDVDDDDDGRDHDDDDHDAAGHHDFGHDGLGGAASTPAAAATSTGAPLG